MMSRSLAPKVGTMKWEDEVFALQSIPTSPIYFDNASCISYLNGLVGVTLTGSAPNGTSGVQTVATVVAHLKCSVPAAIALRDSIEKAILPAKAVENSESQSYQWVSDLGEV
jgi:hypothetical protein